MCVCEGGRGRWDLEEGISKYLGVLCRQPLWLYRWGGGGGVIFDMRWAEEGEGRRQT